MPAHRYTDTFLDELVEKILKYIRDWNLENENIICFQKAKVAVLKSENVSEIGRRMFEIYYRKNERHYT